MAALIVIFITIAIFSAITFGGLIVLVICLAKENQGNIEKIPAPEKFVQLATERGWNTEQTAIGELPNNARGIKAQAPYFNAYYVKTSPIEANKLYEIIKQDFRKAANNEMTWPVEIESNVVDKYYFKHNGLYYIVIRMGDVVLLTTTYEQYTQYVDEFFTILTHWPPRLCYLHYNAKKKINYLVY